MIKPGNLLRHKYTNKIYLVLDTEIDFDTLSDEPHYTRYVILDLQDKGKRNTSGIIDSDIEPEGDFILLKFGE